MYKLPGQTRRWITDADRPFAGILTRSIGFDHSKTKGVLRPSKLKLLNTKSDYSNGELGDEPVAFTFYNGRYWCHDGDRLLRTNNSSSVPSDEFIEDTFTSSPTTLDPRGDIELFNGDMYVSKDTSIYKLSGSTWTEPITGLTNNTLTLLKTVENRLYYTDNNVFVGSVNTSDVEAETVNTLDLQLSNNNDLQYEITMLEAGTNNLWIGTRNNGSAPNWVYAWNGETEDTFTARYVINANVMAGMVRKKDNRPYIFDNLGRLQAFNGAGFETVAELPLTGRLTENAVHYNGMTESEDGEILINFVNDITGDLTTYPTDAPSGVYAYSEETGLYLKHPYTTQRVTETGVTGVDDYAIGRIRQAGAIFNAVRVGRENIQADGDLLVGASYFLDATESNENGIFLSHTNENSLCHSTIVTRWMESAGGTDSFNNCIVQHGKLDAGESVTVKYRTEVAPAISGTIIPTSRYKLTLGSEFDYLYDRYQKGEGVEFMFTEGSEAGRPFNVKRVEQIDGGYELTVDREIQDDTTERKFVIENWKQAKVNTDEGSQLTLADISTTATKLQVKVDMLTTRATIDGLIINNEPVSVV